MIEKKNQLEKSVASSKAGRLKAHQFMSRDVMAIQEGYSIKTAIEILKVHKISGAPVIKPTGELIGIISSYDLLIQASVNDLHSSIKFNTNVFSITEEMTLKEIIILLYKKKFRRLPVVNSYNKVTGIVSRIDVLSKILKS
ncbi:MAG: CBS domain-containing protein [Bacteriovoracaceae bacterium]|jgi:predicted transcriptional regulator|nr:CBS domain-containing protein [Bacteriovoracaceae bacterium]